MTSIYPVGDKIEIAFNGSELQQTYSQHVGTGTAAPIVTQSAKTLADSDPIALPPISGLSPNCESTIRLANGSGARVISPASGDTLQDASGNHLSSLTIKPDELWDFYNVPGTGHWTAWRGAGAA